MMKMVDALRQLDSKARSQGPTQLRAEHATRIDQSMDEVLHATTQLIQGSAQFEAERGHDSQANAQKFYRTRQHAAGTPTPRSPHLPAPPRQEPPTAEEPIATVASFSHQIADIQLDPPRSSTPTTASPIWLAEPSDGLNAVELPTVGIEAAGRDAVGIEEFENSVNELEKVIAGFCFDDFGSDPKVVDEPVVSPAKQIHPAVELPPATRPPATETNNNVPAERPIQATHATPVGELLDELLDVAPVAEWGHDVAAETEVSESKASTEVLSETTYQMDATWIAAGGPVGDDSDALFRDDEEPPVAALFVKEPSLTAYEERVRRLLSGTKVGPQYTQLASRLTAELPRGARGSIAILSVDAEEHNCEVLNCLAVMFSVEKGRNQDVMMVDGNLHHLEITKKLMLQQSVGLADVCGGKADWQSTIKRLATPGICVLPAGGRVAREHLQVECLAPMLDQWTERYGRVLIDGGQVGGPLASLWSQLCDSTYLLVRLGKTPRAEATAAVQSLKTAGANLRGVIVTNVMG